MDGLILRRAVADDLPAIVRMLADDDHGRLRDDPSVPLDPIYAAAFRAIDRDPGQMLIVAELDGATVGTTQLSIVPGLSNRGASKMIVEAVRVSSERRGAGIGAAMIRWAIDRAREGRCLTIQLTSHADRTAAHRFYERLGFHASHVGMKLRLDGGGA